MLSINKSYFYILAYLTLAQIPSTIFLKSADELGVMLMLCLVAIDITVNNNILKYKHLFIVVGIMLFYALYSLVILSYNTPYAIFYDTVLQLKPYVPFFVAFAIAPQLTHNQKKTIKYICIITATLIPILFFTQLSFILDIHVSTLGHYAVVCFLLYMYCSMKDDATIDKTDIMWSIFILSTGLTSTRAKYFGIFVIALAYIFLYKPGLLKKISIKQLVTLAAVLITVIIVSWNKIEYYFILGESDTFSADTLESFARPVLYLTSFNILLDHPLLGSGLASFASFASTPDVNYSEIYHLYSINEVWGLSESMPDFICDTFYPELAQFGLIGIALFIYSWVWIYKKLRIVLHIDGKNPFIIGCIAIAFILIESIAGSTFTQMSGIMTMLVLGMITSKYKNINIATSLQIQNQLIADKISNKIKNI